MLDVQDGARMADPLLAAYVPLIILFVVSIANAVMMIVMSHMMGSRRPTPVKEQPYESGMEPRGDARRRFSVDYYIVAILFILFDIETIFLIPWAVVFRDLGLFGFIEGLLFIGVLGVGLVYVWKKGALEWD